MLPEESSSNTCDATLPWKYHVFLSFRGEDTRLNFTDHLYAALQRKGIIAYRDDQQLQRGEVISPELAKAIEDSLAAIIILSKNYASSTWCLDELQKIIESKRLLGREIFPVFYDVCPSEVRYQKESFAEAFRKHERRFEDKEKVRKWRNSLKEVANISGWESKDRPEAELVEDIVEKVWIKLLPKLPSYNDGVVGIESRVKDMNSLLSLGSEDEVRFIRIWGMGGIGKTTLARIIYERIFSQFEISFFLPNIREVSKRSEGLVHLQRRLLSSLKIINLEIDNLYDGKKIIRNLLCNKKVLLILDDISSESQLENLAANQEWFGLGSRIIITTRDKHLLIAHGLCEEYEMKVLNAQDSFQLFTQQAFKGAQLQEVYVEFSKTMVQYAEGLPLALNVLGSFLHRRNLYEWEDALDKIKRVPPNDILNTLRVSYDGLEDEYKALFLDIAFFFTGQHKVKLTQMLKDCGLHPTIGINILIEKSLVTCHQGILEMHDLLQKMARNVVFQESPNDASKRSRLCSLEEINQVWRKNKGTEFIQGIILKLSEPCEVHWDPEAFSRMCNLKVLIILCDLYLPLGLKCLSSSLKILEWKGYPLQDLPLGLSLDELVDLKMHDSKIKRLWNRTPYFRNLKSIDLSDSKDLIQTPNISKVPYLERLVLTGCRNLVEVHQSVAQHKNLVILNLEGCINLKTLPRKLKMDSLKEFNLSGCSKVKKLPEFGESMECLSTLDLHDCKNLASLPESISNLKSLKNLKICGCSKLFKLPNNLKENNALGELDVSGTAIREIPLYNRDSNFLRKSSHNRRAGTINWSWKSFFPLFSFEMYPFREGFKLPPSVFSTLEELNLSFCNLNDGSIPHDLGCLSSLKKLNLSGNHFVGITAGITDLSRLGRLYLYDCPRLETLPMLQPSVHHLFVQNCTQMAPIIFDPQLIRKIFEVYRWKVRPWFIIPGSEIPAWFNNQDYFPLDLQLTDCEYDEEHGSIASIIVDIPDYYHSSEWWGIAVCLSLESTIKIKSYENPSHPIVVRWACKAPDTERQSPLHFGLRQFTHFNGRHLFIVFLGSDHCLIKPHLLGGQNKLQLVFHAKNQHKSGKVTIKNCGCRVVCKEDVQVWHGGIAASQVEMPSNFNDSRVLKQSRITGISDGLEGDESRESDFAELNLHPGRLIKLH